MTPTPPVDPPAPDPADVDPPAPFIDRPVQDVEDVTAPDPEGDPGPPAPAEPCP